MRSRPRLLASLVALALTVTALVGGQLVSAGPAAAATYSCTLNVQSPHHSTHVPETVNVVATIKCSIPVSYLSLQVTLYKRVCDPTCWWANYATGNTKSNTGRASIQANAAGRCTNGRYYGEAIGYIVAPPGKTPPAGEVFGPGPTASVTC